MSRRYEFGRSALHRGALIGVIMSIAGCNDDDRPRPATPAPSPTATFTVSGAVSGLHGTVTLLNNGRDAQAISENGSFAFPTRLTANAAYAVTVESNPANQLCTVTNGSGSVTANVTNVVVACETIRVTATIGPSGGTVIGPDGVQVDIPAGALTEATAIGIARSATGAPSAPTENLVANAIYEFTPHDIAFNEPVTIRMPVAGSANAPTVMMAGVGTGWSEVDAQIENGVAAITRNAFSWGGVFPCIYLPGDPNLDPGGCVTPRGTLSLSSNPAGSVTLTGAALTSPRRYSVSNAGTVQFAFSYHVPASCTNGTARFRRGAVAANGAVQPLVTLTEQFAPMAANNNSPPGRAADGSVTFSVPVSDADNGRWFYQTQLMCTHYRTGPRTYTLAAILDVNVTSSPPVPVPTYSIGGTVNGLSGTGLVLQNNGADDLAITANGTFAFANEIAAGETFNVSVRTQPANPTQVCQVQNGAGTASSNVTNIVVQCTEPNAKSWRAAQLIDNHSAGEAELPQVGFDASGNATVVWTFATRDPITAELTSEIWSNRYSPSGGWGTPVRVTQSIGNGIQDLKLAVFANGEAVAVWLQSAGRDDDVYSSRYVPATGWAAPTLLENNAAHAESLSIGFETSGTAFAIWLQETGPFQTEDVWASRYVVGSGWSAPALLENRDDGAGDPVIAVSADGTAIALWGQNDEESYLRMNRYVAGTGWTGDSNVTQTINYPSDELVAAMDDAGRAVVAYTRSGFSGAVFGLRYAGGAWTALEPLNAAPTFYPARLTVAMRGSGEALVMWAEGEGLTDMWAKPFGVLTGDAMPVGDGASGGVRPAVAFDVDGTAIAVWNHGVGGRVLASRYTHGAATPWSTPAAIVSGVSPSDARLAIDPLGNVIVVWQQQVGSGHSDIAAALYR